MQVGHLRRECAAHRQPHDDLGAFHAAQRCELGLRHVGQLFGVLLEQVEKLLVPLGIVEAGALAMHLVRQAARGHHHDAQMSSG